MKHLKKFNLGIFLALALGFSSQAHALLSTSIKGGLGINKLSSTDVGGTSVPGSSFGLGYQGGLGLDFSLGVASVGVDVLFAQRGQFLVAANSKWNQILVPVQAKFALIPLLSLGVGAYYAQGIGDISIEDANGNSLGTTTFDAAGFSNADFGAVASVGISLPLGVTTLSVEGRYLYGLKNLQANATGDASAKMSAFDMLVGVTF